MRERVVVFSPEARDDLLSLYDWIADAAGEQIALRYIQRLETYCMSFSRAAERGVARRDIRPGLRIVGFERRVTIAFSVDDQSVTILRLFYGGRNWEKVLR